MNDICEIWHLPWHALQKDLALELSADARRLTTPNAKPTIVQNASASTVTWMGRARQRVTPGTVADRQ